MGGREHLDKPTGSELLNRYEKELFPIIDRMLTDGAMKRGEDGTFILTADGFANLTLQLAGASASVWKAWRPTVPEDELTRVLRTVLDEAGIQAHRKGCVGNMRDYVGRAERRNKHIGCPGCTAEAALKRAEDRRELVQRHQTRRKDEIERQQELINAGNALAEALSWASGSKDFAEGGPAREGWVNSARPALESWTKLMREEPQ
jgi:hypothetical protein